MEDIETTTLIVDGETVSIGQFSSYLKALDEYKRKGFLTVPTCHVHEGQIRIIENIEGRARALKTACNRFRSNDPLSLTLAIAIDKTIDRTKSDSMDRYAIVAWLNPLSYIRAQRKIEENTDKWRLQHFDGSKNYASANLKNNQTLSDSWSREVSRKLKERENANKLPVAGDHPLDLD